LYRYRSIRTDLFLKNYHIYTANIRLQVNQYQHLPTSSM